MTKYCNLYDNKIADYIARALLDTKAVMINYKKPYKWASGWLSPIYCDNRVLLSYISERKLVTDSLVSLITVKFPEIDGVIGVATAGIPQGVLVAEKLGLPFLYVRSNAKKHGTSKLIEGVLHPNKSYVMIEDLISTGGSSLKAARAVKEAGAIVKAIVATFTYGFDTAEQAFKNADIPLHYLCDYQSTIEVINKNTTIGQDELQSLETWRQKPQAWKGV